LEDGCEKLGSLDGIELGWLDGIEQGSLDDDSAPQEMLKVGSTNDYRTSIPG
jgi:hypothetical protein